MTAARIRPAIIAASAALLALLAFIDFGRVEDQAMYSCVLALPVLWLGGYALTRVSGAWRFVIVALAAFALVVCVMNTQVYWMR